MRSAHAIAVILFFGLGAVAPLGVVRADSYTDEMFRQGTEQYYRYEEQNRRGIEERERAERERAEEEKRRNEQHESWMRSEAEKRDREYNASGAAGNGEEGRAAAKFLLDLAALTLGRRMYEQQQWRCLSSA